MQESRPVKLATYVYGFPIILSLAVLAYRQELSLLSPLPLARLCPWLLYAFLVALVTILLSRLLSRCFEWATTMEREFYTVLGPLHRQETFLLALLSSLGEEMFFRGVLQPKLGLLPTTLIFSLVHVPLKRTLIPWTLFAFAMGLILGILFEYSSNLWPPILLHFLVNDQNLTYISRKFRDDSSAALSGSGEEGEENRIQTDTTG